MEHAAGQVAGQSDAESDEFLAAQPAGDGMAFGLIFDRHQARVFKHAYRFASSRQDAEDLVAGAFLELWRRRDRVLSLARLQAPVPARERPQSCFTVTSPRRREVANGIASRTVFECGLRSIRPPHV